MTQRRKRGVHGLVLFVCVWGGLVTCALAQNPSARESSRRIRTAADHKSKTLTKDDGREVVAVALDERIHMGRNRDCSHLVHAIYEQAGFSYPYASSSDLYRGTDDFRRVKKPQPGDLVVWRGHVGIVVNPATREFYSFLRHGPGIDEYDAQYWKERGPVRFYRFIKNSSQEVYRTEE
ncbi:MAG TPA: NlpC/P60 family protein [Terriglobales bacterium]|nr:NlpC/P60 family protein [Terriglobales bacterium]